MKYCVVQYEIKYKNGEQNSALVPFRNGSIETENIQRFIKGYFAGPNPYDEMIVKIVKEYQDPKEWLTEVKNWETFKYLRTVNNFAGELMEKYFPGE